MATEENVSRRKAIQIVPNSEEEYEEIRKAAEREMRSLASYCLYHSLTAARENNNIGK